jgi:uncharacterized membrane protein
MAHAKVFYPPKGTGGRLSPGAPLLFVNLINVIKVVYLKKREFWVVVLTANFSGASHKSCSICYALKELDFIHFLGYLRDSITRDISDSHKTSKTKTARLSG